MARKRLGELLVMAGAIDEFQLQSALGEQRRWGRALGMTMVEMGLLDEGTLVRVLSQQLNIPAIDLQAVMIEPEALALLDHDLCSEYQCVPFRYESSGKFLHVAMADPTNLEVFDRLRVKTRCNIRPYLGGPKAIEVTIRRKYLGDTAGATSYDEAVDNRHWMTPSNEQVFDPEPERIAPPPAAQQMRSVELDLGLEEETPAPQRREGGVEPASIEHQLTHVLEELRDVKAFLHRDEMVLRKLMSLIVEKGLCTREELVARLHED
ncbi:MAG: hypothetical protein JRH20_24705 [Deltaproteobacteria bacterium]|nr:hypothetical protein [Deltaproteobacteria bacterium]